MHFNPYIAGNPLDSDGFFGREDIFRDVNAVLRHPHQNAIVLYGQRRIGKTSILLQLERRLKKDAQFTPVYFDLMDRADKPLADVLYELARRISLALDLSPPHSDAFKGTDDAFREQFLPKAAQAAAAGGLALLFDEFDVLDSPEQGQAGHTFFPYLRQWMSRMPQVQFVFVIGRRPEDLSINTLSTFKGVKSTQVALLDKKNAKAVMRQSEKDGSLFWQDEAIAEVWRWTQGHPFFTQL
ncbi:MAG: ATP-binding protein, partial [Anaerolineae bacterium]